MKGEERFNNIRPKYEKAYKEINNKEIHSIFYKNGYCYLIPTEYGSTSKFRIGDLEKMTETLNRRIQDKIKDDTAKEQVKFYQLPTWLQGIWDLDSSLARQAEKDFNGYLKLKKSDNMEDLPSWLQELWTLDSSLARQSERYFRDRLVGFKTYRLDSNPEEVVFHKTFRTEHLEAKHSCKLDLLIFPSEDQSGGTPSEYLTDREKEVMLSTIQWLGSPIGQSFLNKCGYTKTK